MEFKFTSWGMWEEARLALENALVILLGEERRDEIQAVLFTKVIPEYVAGNISVHRNPDNAQLTASEKGEKGYETALGKVLPTLSKWLKVEEAILVEPVDEFKNSFENIRKEFLPSFMQHCQPARTKIINEKIKQAYGDEWVTKNPDAATVRYYQDSQLVKAVADELIQYIEELNIDNDMKALFKKHHPFMTEAAHQMKDLSLLADQQIAELNAKANESNLAQVHVQEGLEAEDPRQVNVKVSNQRGTLYAVERGTDKEEAERYNNSFGAYPLRNGY